MVAVGAEREEWDRREAAGVFVRFGFERGELVAADVSSVNRVERQVVFFCEPAQPVDVALDWDRLPVEVGEHDRVRAGDFVVDGHQHQDGRLHSPAHGENVYGSSRWDFGLDLHLWVWVFVEFGIGRLAVAV